MNSKVKRWVDLNLAFHALNKAAEQRLGLSLVQYRLLETLRDMPGCAPNRLAETVGMHPSSLTQSLKRLNRKQALFVDEDPRDSRKKILSLTRLGRDLMIRFDQGLDGVLTELKKPE
ncbi:MAG: MarR family transcriptional regulator [Bdellovibrionales bacterium]|nr:MarR family transcriptional regulator [Bdellovibrionales bacterium]